MVLTAFFGYFLPLLAESTPSETKHEVRCEGILRIATGAERPRNDMVFGKGCGETGRPGGRPLRVHGNRSGASLVQADAGIGPYGCVAGDGPLHEGKLIG